MLRFDHIYIISYLGQHDQDKRLDIHNRQLDWAISQNLKPIVLAQHYKDEWYRDDVEYIKHDGMLLRQVEARNILLNHFYASDQDFAIFADNDCYLYQGEKYGYNDRFVDTFRNIPKQNLDSIDLFVAINPKNQPFTKDFETNKRLYETRWSFSPAFIASGLFVLRNLKKFYDDEIYFDMNMIKEDRSIIACEDQDLPIQMIMKNYGTFVCNNIVMKEEGSTSSTWTKNDKELRRKLTKEGHDYISNKFNLPIQSESEKGIWMKTFKKKNKKLKPRLVPIIEVYADETKQLFEGLL